MIIIRPKIIAPDSSHWSKWIDGALSCDSAKRLAAQNFHDRMLKNGNVPFLSWHHLYELLSVGSAAKANARVKFLQSLPLIAWMRVAGEAALGSITDILAAEAIAYDAGCSGLVEVRDQVRSQLIQVGPGINAVGQENWVWDALRPLMIEQRPHSAMVAALGGTGFMDENRTVGQLATQRQRSPAEKRIVLTRIHAKAVREAREADPLRSVEEAQHMADSFLLKVLKLMPEEDVPVRELIVATYGRYGLTPEEVRDDRTLAELSTLATFRSHLRIVAEKAGLPFDRLIRVRMESLPSWQIRDALKRHGQRRRRRPGSDIHDEHLAALAAYTDVLFVDKRTHEDFRRVVQKDPDLAKLFGSIAKAGDYEQLII